VRLLVECGGRNNHIWSHIGLTPVIFIVFLLFVTIATEIALGKLENDIRKEYGHTLETVLGISHEAVGILVEDRISDTQSMASRQEFLRYLEKEPGTHSKIYQGKFSETHTHKGLIGYALVRADFTVAALSERLSYKVNKDTFVSLSDKLSKVLEGNGVFLPPAQGEVILENNGTPTINKPIIIIAAPIKRGDGTVAGALLRISDPAVDFSTITHLGRLGKTGETYSFNRDGKLLTNPRFRKLLIEIGLISADEESILNITLKDPGEHVRHVLSSEAEYAQRPFTVMAQSALSKNMGLNITGYNDYRGERVLGAWLWDEKLNIGFASEIDEAEVLDKFNNTKYVVGATLLAVAMCAIISCSFLMMNRRNYELSLIAAKEGAEKADKAKTLFMSSMSHELRTPLTSIIGFSEQVASENLGPLNNLQKDVLGRVQRCGTNLLALINEVLDYVRIESEQEEPRLLNVSIDYVLTSAICQLEHSMDIGKVQIVVDENMKQSRILTDANHLQRILINLLSNAIKHGSSDGEIIVSSQQLDESFIRVSVQDRGPGIPEEKLKYIFEPFDRIGREGLNISGSGIGLSFVKKLTELIGGRIMVESQVDRGTVVHLDLPVANTNYDAPPKPITVLHVEDDPDTA